MLNIERFKKDHINVTDLAMQIWCEKQLELSIMNPQEATESMKIGRSVHLVLEKAVSIPVNIKATNRKEQLYKSIFTAYYRIKVLKDRGIGSVREIPIYAIIDDLVIAGKIDQLSFFNNELVIVEDKTKSTEIFNSMLNDGRIAAYLNRDTYQLNIYRYMIDSLKRIDGESFMNNLESKLRLSSLSVRERFIEDINRIDPRIDSIKQLFKEFINELNEIRFSDRMSIRYIDRNDSESVLERYDVIYRRDRIEDKLRSLLEYWKTDREAKGVSENEAWKCKSCIFYRRAICNITPLKRNDLYGSSR
ncbi:MAG: hypothetical protein ARM1_0054 [Candidatus Micrarchaeota archaeon]|nr:MAG: hypothetical protein ARM1_0054 [Candidatus Micrarchaeota archaeon]